nr:ATP-binding protein [Paenibacillus crassostreae]
MSIGYLILTMLSGAMHVYLSEIMFVQLFHIEQLKTISENYIHGEEQLQQVMDVAPLCMVSFNRNGKVTSINEMMMNLLKKQNPQLIKENVLGNSISLFADLVEQGVIELQLTKALNGNISEHELNYSDSRTYYTRCSPLTNTFTGGIIGAVLVIQDITELERLRSELGNVDRLSLVGQMAASITHEIRNPMAVVHGFMQLMREKSPGSLDHYYRIVMEELDRVNSIINNFLSLAQNRVSEMEDCHLHTIINELNPLLSADANLRGHTIVLDLDENVPELRLNAKEIKQLILNLARNGMEAMDDKGQLTLQTKMSLNSVDLIIKDSGSGISQNEIDQLFVPFFTTKEQGTGLGLVLCLSIVERHKGKITVDSKVGGGTMFTVGFPRGISVIEHISGA